MKIPKQEDFAVLLMGELTNNYQRRLVSLSEISRRHGVSVLFLKKIARLLRRRGLIDSKEGIGGGYMLSRQPRTITVWEIVDAVSGVRSVPVRLWREACPINTKCLPQHLNRIVQESIEQSLKRLTLETILSQP